MQSLCNYISPAGLSALCKQPTRDHCTVDKRGSKINHFTTRKRAGEGEQGRGSLLMEDCQKLISSQGATAFSPGGT
jgi:hypothetical protein